MANSSLKVYHDLRRDILTGKLSPSQSLVESTLANNMNVSRNTIRKALLMLERDNLITIESNKSAKVRKFEPQEVLDLLEFKHTVECFAMEKTVPVITDAQIRKAEKTLKKLDALVDKQDLLEYPKLNSVFHAQIYEGCPNKISIETIDMLKSLLVRYDLKTVFIPGQDKRSQQEHHQLIAYLKARDTENAIKCISAHLDHVRDLVNNNQALFF